MNYAGDNWLRCWFCAIDPSVVGITTSIATTARYLNASEAVVVKEMTRLYRTQEQGEPEAIQDGITKRGAVMREANGALVM